MLYRLLIIVLLILAELPVDAATLKGVILANELSGPPIENVGVDAISGTNLTISDLSGKFTLEFPQRRAGDTVRIIVKKEGYVIVNDVQLETVLPADVDAVPLTVILAKEGDREEMARRFYRLKSFEAIETTYQEKLKAAKDAHQADTAALAKLQQERDQARATAEKAAEELAKNQPDQGSELYQQAERLFLDGKIEEALNVLNDEKLRRLATQAQKRKAEAEKDFADAIQAWLLKAHLLAVQFRFDDAERAYFQAIEIAPDNFEANFAFGRFNQELNRYEKARIAYDRCLAWARQRGKNRELADTLNNLGTLDRAQNRPDEARKEYAEALQIRRELAQKDLEIFLPLVAQTLNDLGLLDQLQNRPDEARKEYAEALQIGRELAQKNPESSLADLATTLKSLGLFDILQFRMEEARKELEEALQILRRLAEKDPQTYRPNVAVTLNVIGFLDSDQNRPDDARQEYAEALPIYRELAQKNPETYRPDLVITLNAMGFLDDVQERPDDARKEYGEALEILRELAQKNPEIYRLRVAMLLSMLGNFDREQNRLEEARTELEEALQIWHGPAQQNLEAYLPHVALTLLALGSLDNAQNRPDDARNQLDEALKTFRELAQKNPDAHLPEVANALNFLGNFDSAQNRPDDARKEYAEALQIYRDLAQKNPELFLESIANTLNNLGSFDDAQKRKTQRAIGIM